MEIPNSILNRLEEIHELQMEMQKLPTPFAIVVDELNNFYQIHYHVLHALMHDNADAALRVLDTRVDVMKIKLEARKKQIEQPNGDKKE